MDRMTPILKIEHFVVLGVGFERSTLARCSCDYSADPSGEESGRSDRDCGRSARLRAAGADARTDEALRRVATLQHHRRHAPRNIRTVRTRKQCTTVSSFVLRCDRGIYEEEAFCLQIESIQLLKEPDTGRSRGYGFVTVSPEQSIAIALLRFFAILCCMT